MKPTTSLLSALIFAAAAQPARAQDPASFETDVAFLREHTDLVVLHDDSQKAQVIVAPAWQGRVMTSTARGAAGNSFGWINRALIASDKVQPHFNALGGEDRLWLGPEGGQFSIYFAQGVPFDLEHWFTPAAFDTEPFEVTQRSADHVVCRRAVELVNYSSTHFTLEVTREVRLLPAGELLTQIGASLPPGVDAVAFESVNSVQNTGAAAWRKDTGLLSIWILGMLNASTQSTVVVPFVEGPEAERGAIVNDEYFGKVPADRPIVQPGVVFFRADARHRSKIGFSPRRAKSVLGSYDAVHHTLTLVRFTLPSGATDYVNSMWQLQDHPYGGDVVNSYNDDGKMGGFYELESSSPALALQPGASATHRHQTVHLQGDEKALDAIARSALGVGLETIKTAFGN